MPPIVRIADKKGKFNILSEPIKGEVYIAGIDPIPFGDKNINDGSDYAILIGGLYSGELVGYYAERSMDSEYVVGNGILLQEYFASEKFPDGAPAMMEMNRGEVALKVYEQKSKLHLLAKQASHLGREFIRKNGRFGWSNNDPTGGAGTNPKANDYLIQYLKLHAEKIRFRRLLDELYRFPKGNNDLLDALKGYVIFQNELHISTSKKYEEPKTTLRPYVTLENGVSVKKWIEVPIRN